MNQTCILDLTALSIFGLPALRWASLRSVMSLNLSAVGFPGEMAIVVELGDPQRSKEIPTLLLGDT